MTATNSPSPTEGLRQFFFSEDNPANTLSLITVVVVIAHLLFAIWLNTAEEELTPAQPFAMEVSMVSVASPKPAVTPPVPTPPKPAEPVKKTPPKPVIPKPKVAPSPEPAPQAAPASEPVSQPQAPASASQARTAETSTASQTNYIEASFRANYLHNPKPEYPSVAKNRGWQGKVLLRVIVSADGVAQSVTIETSSGHEILDESALEAVQRWKFVPAKRGDTNVQSSVIVPIVFTLKD
jgi:periplasmic protein TonB